MNSLWRTAQNALIIIFTAGLCGIFSAESGRSMQKRSEDNMKKILVLALCAMLGLSGCTVPISSSSSDSVGRDASSSDETSSDLPESENADEETETPDENEEPEIPKTEGKLASLASSSAGMVSNSGEMKYIAYYCPSFDPGATTQVLTVCTLQYSEEYSREGNLTAVLGADDRVFFSMDDCLYSYSFDDGEQLLASGLSYPELVGLIDGRLYFKVYTDDPSVAEVSLGVYDLDTGEQTTVPLENGWGNVAMTVAGDHLFYIGGRTDVSATPLYEVNLETWEIEQLEAHTVSMAYAENGSLYYLSTDANDTISGTQTLKKRDLLTGDVTELCQGAADEFGEMLMANGYGAFFRNITESGSIRLSLRDDETGEETVIQSGVSTNYVPDAEGNGFYYSQCPTNSDGEVISSTVYQYSEAPDAENHADLVSNQSVHTGNILGVGSGSLMVYTREHTDSGDTEGYYVEQATIVRYSE